jgi:hypothetical protein
MTIGALMRDLQRDLAAKGEPGDRVGGQPAESVAQIPASAASRKLFPAAM